MTRKRTQQAQASAAKPRRRGTHRSIPATRAARQAVLGLVRRRIAAQRPVPPLSLSELRALSDEVLAAGKLPEKFRGFVAVLINNEAWRDSLAAIPHNRRLLLLPKCLRNTERCRAKWDEFGLVCAGCGACLIHAYKTEAEQLGYTVLVAEGAPVVMSLVRTGKIEAVVGASCMAALERIFPLIEAAAVPGIAIPLLRDGCADTGIDPDWLWNAIRLESDGSSPTLDIDALRRRVDGWFTPRALDAVLGRAQGQTADLARAWLAKSGKRWRPFLAACAYEAYENGDTVAGPDDLHRIALAVECFHKASLIHDDIEDHDTMRYGQMTLHAQYGVPIALNVGDFLIGEGYRLIAESSAPAGARAAMLLAAAHGHRSLCLGQGSELSWTREPKPLTSAQVIDIFRQKTAPAFEVALRLGAILAAAPAGVPDVLARFSEALGIAYQIRDDIQDWRGDGDPTDRLAMRPSILLAIAHERAKGRAKRLIGGAWRRTLKGPAQEKALAALMDSLGIERAAIDRLTFYRDEAVSALRPIESTALKALLRRVNFKIFTDAHGGDSLGEPQAPDASRRRAGTEPAA